MSVSEDEYEAPEMREYCTVYSTTMNLSKYKVRKTTISSTLSPCDDSLHPSTDARPPFTIYHFSFLFFLPLCGHSVRTSEGEGGEGIATIKCFSNPPGKRRGRYASLYSTVLRRCDDGRPLPFGWHLAPAIMWNPSKVKVQYST